LAYDPAEVLRSQDHPRVEALRCVPLFAVLDKRDLETVERISSEVEVAAGEELIHENAPGRQFFVLLEGQAKVLRDGAEINAMGPGDFFGEIALLSDRPTTASVETSTPARLIVIAPADFRQLLEDMPLLQMKVIQALADRLPDEFYSLG
jgi:CRP-like cAMP-binding protein